MGRRKNRWILAKVNLRDNTNGWAKVSRILTREIVETEIRLLCDILFGSIGGSYVTDATNVALVDDSDALVLIQTKRSFLSNVICVLNCIDSLQKVGVTLEIVHVGGTLHQCKKLLFTKLLDTLAQLQALSLGQSPVKQLHTERAINKISEVSKLKASTAL
ncbi:ribonuclease P/MRP family protein subunit [Babesia bovis T2Bo]|uniref:ribonuclease P/MRP family protein subunit n=1 Tax=Babesia bovis T2Bo TaxID=484906 RepID=UPI001D228E18|nr:ribonuclease P/MRP family protein subunit [Babesia bovis T2Bo]KAG6439960.1 ribonuclease P/MRP family protein subunit [Babesia bovis T2Bo]